MKKLFGLSAKYPKTTLLITAVLTVFMLLGAINVRITEDREKFLPEEHTAYKVLKDYENMTGKLITEAVMVEGVDLTSARAFKDIDLLVSELWEHPDLEGFSLWIRSYTGYVIQALEEQFPDWRNLEDAKLELEIDRLLERPDIKKDTAIYISDERDGAVLTLIINNSLSEEELKEKTLRLQELTDEYDEKIESLKLSNTGTISTDIAIIQGMIGDLSLLVPLAALFILFVLFITFKKILDMVMPFIVLIVGVVWMIGTMGIFNIPFYSNFTIIIPLLMGVGIDYTIHMLTRYYQERRKSNAEAAVFSSIRTVGVAIFLTAITTIIGFLSFGISEMPPIKNFGLVAGLGVLYVFLLSNTLLPSLLVMRDRKKGKTAAEEGISGKSLNWIIGWVERVVLSKHSTIILIAVAVIILLAIIPIKDITTTMSSDIMMPQNAEAIRTQKALEGYFRGYGTESKAFVLLQGDVVTLDALEVTEQFQSNIINHPENDGLIMGTTSLQNMVRTVNGGDLPQNQERLEEIIRYLDEDPDPRFDKILLSEDKMVVNISYETDTMDEQAKATELIRNEITRFNDQQDTLLMLYQGDPAVSGMPVVFSDISSSIKPDLVSSILLAVVLVFISMALVFKSLALGLIGSIPVVITLILELAILSVMHIPMNVMNMLVSSIAIGVGVDFTIHIMHRFREEWIQWERSPEQSVAVTLQSTGKGMFSAAITTIGAFAIIGLSSSPMLVSFGWLSLLVISLSLIMSMIVLPVILVRYASRKNKR